MNNTEKRRTEKDTLILIKYFKAQETWNNMEEGRREGDQIMLALTWKKVEVNMTATDYMV